MSLEPGTKVRIELRFPEDEGFARRCINHATGVVSSESVLPNDERLLVQIDDSDTRALVHPRELIVVVEFNRFEQVWYVPQTTWDGQFRAGLVYSACYVSPDPEQSEEFAVIRLANGRDITVDRASVVKVEKDRYGNPIVPKQGS